MLTGQRQSISADCSKTGTTVDDLAVVLMCLRICTEQKVSCTPLCNISV